MYTKLFPKELYDKLPPLSKFRSPRIVCLLKSHGKSINKLRQLINRWFKNIPTDDQKDLGSRLRSKDDRQHFPAYFELVWHQFFLEEGWGVTIHPDLPNSQNKPDFKISLNRSDLYVEVATVFENKEMREKEERFEKFLGVLDKIEHYFAVTVWLKTDLPKTFDLKRDGKLVADYLKKELDKLDSKTQARGRSITRRYTHNGIDVKFTFNAWKKVAKRKIISGWSGGGYSGNARDQIKKALEIKVKKYRAVKNIGKPLVVVICSDGHPTVDENALDTALYGNHMVTWTVGSTDNTSEWTRDRTGMVTPTPAFPNPMNTRLSAVIFCQEKPNKEKVFYTMKVFHNPWAVNPLPDNIFTKFPQLVVKEKTENKITSDWTIDDPNWVIEFI